MSAAVAGLAVAATLAALAVVTVLVATARWNRATRRLRTRLEGGARAPAGLGRADEAGLPAPVLRYLRRSLPPGAAAVRMATLRQEGAFQMGRGDAGWRRFEAAHHMRAYPPGFLWDATIAMAPGVPVRVRDGYLDGTGMMKGAVASLVVVVEGRPTRELAEGALYRYVAEAAWMPTRLLPGEGLTWRAVDDTTAEATLRDGDVEVSVRFRFDAAGDIVGTLVPARGREVEGVYVPTPWVGRFWDHAEINGFRVPLQGEVAWIVGGVEEPYWKGRLTSASYRNSTIPS